jgi:hypothetical protein
MRSNSTLKRVGLLTLPLLSTVLAALFWPYFPVVSTIFASGTFHKIAFAANWQAWYRNTAWKILPALFGLPFLVYQLFKRQFTYGSFGLVATASVYFFNYAVLHNSTLARYVIFIAFVCHVGIIQNLKYIERHMFHKYFVAGYLIILVFFAPPQLLQSAKRIGPLRDIVRGKPIGTHSNITAFRQYSALRQYVGNFDVVMAPMQISWYLPGVIGCRVVGVMHSNPFMSDFFERKLATQRFFTDGGTVADRSNILSYYSVSHVLIPKANEAVIADFIANLKLVHKDKDFALYSIK